jgi:hypothetical protein
MSEKIVYLMRGLPACGKSFTAQRLAGTTGVVLETDQYFCTQVGDTPAYYDYREDLLPEARRWNFARFQEAVAAGASPIVVDRGNGLNAETQQYALHAVAHGYRVELREPESEWWQEIRVLLKYKHLTREVLYQWAAQLAELSRYSHRVPASTIRSWMDSWRHDLTVEDILRFPGDGTATPAQQPALRPE